MPEILDTIPCGKYSMPVIYLDNHLLGIVKPMNAPVQRDISGDMDVLTACKGYIKQKFDKPGDVYLGLVHRLDRPVGGVMVLARTSKAAQRLSKVFADHTIDKKYLAVVRGRIEEPALLHDWLLKDKNSGTSSVVTEDTPFSKEALLRTEPLAYAEDTDGSPLTLTQVTLMTGRSHQIRLQHAHAGHPLWGDTRYGDGVPGQQIALWAYKLVIPHPTLKTDVVFTCPPPAEGVWRRFAFER